MRTDTEVLGARLEERVLRRLGVLTRAEGVGSGLLASLGGLGGLVIETGIISDTCDSMKAVAASVNPEL